MLSWLPMQTSVASTSAWGRSSSIATFSPAPMPSLPAPMVSRPSARTSDITAPAGPHGWLNDYVYVGTLHSLRPRPQVLDLWRRSGFLQRLGEDHIFPDKRSAIATIVPRLDPQVCERCTKRVFEECAMRPGASIDAGL